MLKGDTDSETEGSLGKLQDIKNDTDGLIREQKARFKGLRGGMQIVNLISKSPSGQILCRVLKAKEAESRASLAKL